MTQKMSSHEVYKRWGDLLAEMSRAHPPIMIEDEGKVLGVLMSAADFEAIERRRDEDRCRGWDAVERVNSANAHWDPDEVYQDVTDAVKEVRRERAANRRAD